MNSLRCVLDLVLHETIIKGSIILLYSTSIIISDAKSSFKCYSYNYVSTLDVVAILLVTRNALLTISI